MRTKIADTAHSGRCGGEWLHRIFLAIAVVSLVSAAAAARNPYRNNFFDAYPSANNTRLDDVPSNSNHCGVCHFDFEGGGPRNLYGLAVEGTNRSVSAILGLGGLDSDGDGFTNNAEITDLVNYVNTPTFPGLKASNVSSVSNVALGDIQDYLTPAAGADTTPPTVTVIAPNGTESLTANEATSILWTATDAGGVAAVDVYLSLDAGATYTPIAIGLSNTGSHTWFPANRPTALALVRVQAIDNAFNMGADESNAEFEIVSPAGGLAPTTLRDFDMPGSQPFESGILNPPTACSPCHGNYDSDVEPYFNWQGSMMAHASIDPLFEANMAIANQDAPDSGDLCLRCHLSRGWHQGRSVPTDGSQMLAADAVGVSCDLCHRLVDPIYDPAQNPSEDAAILAALSFPGTEFGNGMVVIDPTGARRGPFLNAASGHPVLVSPFHREAAFCGTCHDVSNPAFEKDGSGNYVPNAFDAPATSFSSHVIAPVERTYSEWFYSDYNTPTGVYAPQFGGNKDFVSTCQDCHMRDVTGQGCNLDPPVRTDLPLHDMTGGSTWLPGLFSALFPGQVNETALQAGIVRARYMLQNAAELAVTQQGRELKVTVTNNTGHKLPTGYPEGRRMWINVKFLDQAMTVIEESGAYDPDTGVLSHDEHARIYHVEPGLDSITAPLVGVPPGPSFHFVLNNKIYTDNRIPPRGFNNADYAQFGGAPVGHAYSDGQFWDDAYYEIPDQAVSAEVTLYYQSTSKEFVEFLRDENITNSKGQEMYDLWINNGKCPPETMASAQIGIEPPLPGDFDGDGDVDDIDYLHFADCLAGPNQTPAPVLPDVSASECQEVFDFDADSDVDARDFGILNLGWTG